MPQPINISASRGAAILTYYDADLKAMRPLSKYQTPDSVWLQIMESREPGFCAAHKYELSVIEDNPAMRWGRAFESAIIELADERFPERFIRDRETLYEKDFITCHIDGLYAFHGMQKTDILHEGKTTTLYYWYDNFGEPGTDRVPIEYQVQCQHQMICTGAEKVILSVIVFPERPEKWEEMGIIPNIDDVGNYYLINNDGIMINTCSRWAAVLSEMGFFHQYEITADPELQKRMIADYTEWWEKYVIGKTPPPPTHYNDIRALLTEPIGTIIATPEIESLMVERKQIQSEIKGSGPLAKRAEMIKVQVLDYMRTHGADAVDDDSVNKMILRSGSGEKLFSYGKNKNGKLYSR